MELLFLLSTYRIPHVCDFCMNGKIFWIVVTIPILTAPVYLSAMWALYYISRPRIFNQPVPAVVIFSLYPFHNFNFISIAITSFAYIYYVFILMLVSTPNETYIGSILFNTYASHCE